MKKQENFKSLRQVSDIIEDIASDNGLDDISVYGIFDEFFYTLKQQIESKSAPKIMISNWGHYSCHIKRVNTQIEKLIEKLRYYKQGSPIYNIYELEFKRLWNIRRRLQKEKNGEETYKDWKNREA